MVVGASPRGLGGVLAHCATGTVLEFCRSALTHEDESRFRNAIGYPAGQTTWETLAFLVGVRLWAPRLQGKGVALRVKGDNVGMLTVAIML